MSKSYKLKRAYTILKALSAVSIGGLALNSFITLCSGTAETQDVLTVVIGLLSVLYFAASYSKADMERDDLMEKALKTIEKNKHWGKATKKLSESNKNRIDEFEKRNKKS